MPRGCPCVAIELSLQLGHKEADFCAGNFVGQNQSRAIQTQAKNSHGIRHYHFDTLDKRLCRMVSSFSGAFDAKKGERLGS